MLYLFTSSNLVKFQNMCILTNYLTFFSPNKTDDIILCFIIQSFCHKIRGCVQHQVHAVYSSEIIQSHCILIILLLSWPKKRECNSCPDGMEIKDRRYSLESSGICHGYHEGEKSINKDHNWNNLLNLNEIHKDHQQIIKLHFLKPSIHY